MDFGSTMVTGISASVVSRLRKKLGLGFPGDRVKVNEPYQMLGEIENGLREKMYIDCIGLFGTKNMFGFENKDWKPWTMFDGTKVLVPGLF
ncbi:MAG: methyltransferase, partial [Candidatus Latescibacteria bacterium]|nr:methyltransferase [Candidatus Latescibacterota bacterium]